MKFTYAMDVHNRCSAGDRMWLCCFEMSRAKTSTWKKMPPMLVEFCCSTKPELETGFRERDLAPNAAIPVKADGTLDWKHPVNMFCVEGFETKEEAMDAYLAKLEAARAEVAEAIINLGKVEEKLLAEIKRFDGEKPGMEEIT